MEQWEKKYIRVNAIETIVKDYSYEELFHIKSRVDFLLSQKESKWIEELKKDADERLGLGGGR